MNKKKVLNLYAGLGGNRKLWQDVEVTAVEMEQDIADVYKAQFPNDTVIIGDAHQYLLDHTDEFDFIWTSPPCQSHSRMMKATRHKVRKYPDMALYQEVIFLQNFFKGQWVVENVKPYYEPLVKPTAILGRHYFWANFEIPYFEVSSPKGFITAGTVAETQKLKDWLGIQYEGNIYYKGNHCPGQVLRNAVHPLLGQHVFSAPNRELGASWRKGVKKEMAQLNAIVKIDIELFRPKKYKDGWYYAVVQGKDKFVGLAKKEPFTCENPDPIKESGELWFEFGDTPSEAFHAIVRAQQSVQATACTCGSTQTYYKNDTRYCVRCDRIRRA